MVLINKSETGWTPRLGLYLFPVLTLIFISTYLINETFYRQLITEDGIVEWLTFTFLIVAASMSIYIASQIRTRHHYIHWFFILFFGFNMLAGLEEISWGQRVFGVETTGVFHKYSDQNEINLHNTFQGIFHIKTKHIALIVLFFYGSILPGLLNSRKLTSDNLIIRQFVVPPLFLRGGFTIAAILMLDFQTGNEEEIGEFFFSLCFFIMMLWNITLSRRGFYRPADYFAVPKRIPSLSE